MDNEKSQQLDENRWLQRAAFQWLRDQRRARRQRWLIKGVSILILIVAFMMMSPDTVNQTRNHPHVAVLSVHGNILDDADTDAAHFVPALTKAFASKWVNQIILDVNSPGGSAVQASEIYRAIRQLRDKYPNKSLIAVCSDSCTSAAYYIATAADKIYANPASIVGSIGVLYDGFGFNNAIDKLGISRRLMTAGKNKGMLDPFSPLRANDKAKLQHVLDEVHQQFITAVKQGRGSRLKISEDTFSGLFWTGEDAKSQGLIDGFASVRELSPNLPHVSYIKKERFLDKLGKELSSRMASLVLSKLGMSSLMISER